MGNELAKRLLKGKNAWVLHSGQWLVYSDANGIGYAQPDHFILGPTSIVVVECKLTQTIAGILQIRELYAPILREIYKLPVVGIMACKHLVTEPGDGLITGPEAVLGTTNEKVWTWHWLGA